MVQRTYYAPAETSDAPRWEPAPDDAHTIRHGYNLADLNVLAKAACRRSYGSRVVQFHDRYELAWSAIAEALCAATEPPSPVDLITAGSAAIIGEAHAAYHHAGISTVEWQPMAAYERYWRWAGRVTPSPESRIVEQVALWQIWARLPERHRRVLLAVASFADHDQAANAFGMSYGTYTELVSKARRSFFALWHEGEEPSPFYRSSRRQRRDDAGRGGRPRITASQLEDARGRHYGGETVTQLAVEYGVTKSWLSKLLRGRHLPAPDQDAHGDLFADQEAS